MSDQKRTPMAPSIPSGSNTELLSKLRELEMRLERVEGRNEEYMIYFSAYTGYLKAYVERYANIANRTQLLRTGIIESQAFAREAVRIYQEGETGKVED